MKYPKLPSPSLLGGIHRNMEGYVAPDLYIYAERFHEANMPVIYVDDTGNVQSRVSIEMVEAVLGPYIDGIRKQINQQEKS